MDHWHGHHEVKHDDVAQERVAKLHQHPGLVVSSLLLHDHEHPGLHGGDPTEEEIDWREEGCGHGVRVH